MVGWAAVGLGDLHVLFQPLWFYDSMSTETIAVMAQVQNKLRFPEQIIFDQTEREKNNTSGKPKGTSNQGDEQLHEGSFKFLQISV